MLSFCTCGSVKTLTIKHNPSLTQTRFNNAGDWLRFSPRLNSHTSKIRLSPECYISFIAHSLLFIPHLEIHLYALKFGGGGYWWKAVGGEGGGDLSYLKAPMLWKASTILYYSSQNHFRASCCVEHSGVCILLMCCAFLLFIAHFMWCVNHTSLPLYRKATQTLTGFIMWSHYVSIWTIKL